MKNLIIIYLLTLTIASYSQIYPKGQVDLNLGIGLGSTLGAGGVGFKSTLPPIGGSINFGIKDNISIGGYVGLSAASQDLSFDRYKFKFNYTYIIVGARGSYFFDINNEKLEPYGGILLGYNIVNFKTVGDLPVSIPFDASGSEVAWSLFGGARYKVSDNLKIYGELGYGIAILQLGVVLHISPK